MPAKAQGYKEGREYASRFDCKKMTFEQYRAMGRTVAKQRYAREKSRNEFLLGWWHAGEQVHSLFKQDDTDYRWGEAKVQHARVMLGSACEDIEALLDWRKDDAELQALLEDIYEAVDKAQDRLDILADRIKHLT